MANTDTNEKPKVPPMTMRDASRGKVVKLHRYFKGMIALMPENSRSHFKKLMIDGTATQTEMKLRQKNPKDRGE